MPGQVAPVAKHVQESDTTYGSIVSTMVASVAVASPMFVTTIVYVSVVPGTYVVTPSSFVTVRSGVVTVRSTEGEAAPVVVSFVDTPLVALG